MAIDLIAQDVFETLSAKTNLPPIYWPNVAVPAAPEALHLRVYILPAGTQSIGLASFDVERGIIQVSIFSTQGAGMIAPFALAEKILGIFPRGYTSPRFVVPLAGSVGPAIYDGAWCVVPVSFNYQNVR